MARYIPAVAGVMMGFMLMGVTDKGPTDADSQAWRSLVSTLSVDNMEGRDTGSGGHASPPLQQLGITW